MRKFTKGCLITAVILFFVGAVFSAVGFAAGAADEMEYMRYEYANNIGLGINFDWHNGNVFSGSMDKTEIAKLEDIDKLDIEFAAGELEIQPSEDDAIYLEVLQGQSYYYEIKNRKLIVEGFDEKRIGIGLNSNRMILYVPENLQEIDLELGAGKVSIDNISCNNLEVSAAAGSTELNEVTYNKGDFEVGMGEIICNNVQGGKSDIEVGMGSFVYSGSIDGNIEASCSMGDITMDIEGSEEDFNYEIECAMGSIELDNKEYSGLAREKMIDNKAERSMDLECAMGSMTVSFY